jgi:hypothetical protein
MTKKEILSLSYCHSPPYTTPCHPWLFFFYLKMRAIQIPYERIADLKGVSILFFFFLFFHFHFHLCMSPPMMLSIFFTIICFREKDTLNTKKNKFQLYYNRLLYESFHVIVYHYYLFCKLVHFKVMRWIIMACYRLYRNIDTSVYYLDK